VVPVHITKKRIHTANETKIMKSEDDCGNYFLISPHFFFSTIQQQHTQKEISDNFILWIYSFMTDVNVIF
jgi:hypothetical protein